MNVSKRDLSIGQQGFVDRVEADQGRTVGLAENSVVQQIAGIHYYNYCSQAEKVVESNLASTENAALQALVESGRKAESLGRCIRRVKIGSREATAQELAEMQTEFSAVMAEIDNGGQQ